MNVFDLPIVDALVRSALGEDLGMGDITTQLTIPAATTARADIVAKQSAVIAGMPLIRTICRIAGGGVDVREHIVDGTPVSSGDVLAALNGSAHTLLSIERVLLNFLQHLSGIATITARFVEAVRGYECRIVDTRKTLPGLRVLEKYAVRVGGGFNHRLRLDDGILIKNNHITAGGGVTTAVTAARAAAPHGLKVEVECRTLQDVTDALAAKADAILLDNMAVEQIRQAVQLVNRRAIVEASGGVALDNVRAIAAAGVDIISVGALTHSAPAIDLHMLVTTVA